MNIAIDISPLDSAHGKRGTGVYTKNLIEALKKYDGRHSYTFFTRKQNIPEHADIVHYPYFDPFFLTLPIAKPKPTIVTVHDLIPLVFPDKFPSGLRGIIKWRIQRYSLTGTRRIITDSENSKRDIRKIIGYPESRIDSVYLAPDPDIRRIQNKKPVSEKYILYVGDVNWNKNIPTLLRAFSQIKRNIKLVFVGSAFTNQNLAETQEINSIVASLGLEASVVRAGYLSSDKLSALYSQASCLVLPSIYEGFGLPVLDAMNCGCPVVAADTSSLSEIAGPAIRIQPENASSITEGLITALTLSAGEKEKLVNAQYAWVTKFSWQKTARQTVVSYEKAFNNHSGI